MEIVLAIGSALFFALGTVLQQRAGLQSPSDAGSGLLLAMVRRPVWLIGIAFDTLGFVAQAAALGTGRLSVVQPLLVTSIVFALPLGVRLSGQPMHRTDIVAAVLVVLALVAFLVLATPSGGHSEAPLDRWLITGGLCAAVCAALLIPARRGPPPRRAALLASAAGVLFALSAGLTKALVDELHRGIVHVVLSWPPYALAGVGYASMTLNQMALNTGALAATIASSTAVDPVVSVLVGVTVFDESLTASGLGAVAAILALVVALGAMTVLARSEAHAVGGEDQVQATQ